MTRERGTLREILDIVEDLLDRDDESLLGQGAEGLEAARHLLERVLANVERAREKNGSN
jgi:hypothetical protein